MAGAVHQLWELPAGHRCLLPGKVWENSSSNLKTKEQLWLRVSQPRRALDQMELLLAEIYQIFKELTPILLKQLHKNRKGRNAMKLFLQIQYNPDIKTR
jgi:hypothetical protein